MRKLDLSGMKFNRLLVISECDDSVKKYGWHCLCDCGSKTIVATGALKSGQIKSCGCLWKERAHKGTHGHTKGGPSATYRSYAAMIRRCYSKDYHEYCEYGGLGILVCDRWREGFKNFLEDMGEAPNGYTLDRINNRLGYSKDNCRWATKKQQARNRKTNRKVDIDGETKSLSEWVEIYGANYGTVYSRIALLGWEPETAIKTPSRTYKHGVSS